jgi:hypothetical protein
MEEKIGRETLQKLLELQIQVLDKYREVLDSGERARAKAAIGNILKAIVDAVGPVFELQQLAYSKTAGLHEEAMAKTRELLNDLLREEKARAEIHNRMREQAERGGGKK